MVNKFFDYGRGFLVYFNYIFVYKMFMCIGECFFKIIVYILDDMRFFL